MPPSPPLPIDAIPLIKTAIKAKLESVLTALNISIPVFVDRVDPLNKEDYPAILLYILDTSLAESIDHITGTCLVDTSLEIQVVGIVKDHVHDFLDTLSHAIISYLHPTALRNMGNNYPLIQWKSRLRDAIPEDTGLEIAVDLLSFNIRHRRTMAVLVEADKPEITTFNPTTYLEN